MRYAITKGIKTSIITSIVTKNEVVIDAFLYSLIDGVNCLINDINSKF